MEHCDGGTTQTFPTKSWHTPYDPKKPTSEFFQVVDWVTVQEIQIDMTVARLKALGITILEPYGHADALLFSFDPAKTEYEVELKIKSGRVADLSFRPTEQRKRPEKWSLNTPISMQEAPSSYATETTVPPR